MTVFGLISIVLIIIKHEIVNYPTEDSQYVKLPHSNWDKGMRDILYNVYNNSIGR